MVDQEGSIHLLHNMLRLVRQRGASDLVLTAGFPPAIKLHGKVTPISDQRLTAAHTQMIALAMMNARQAEEFSSTNECNFAIRPHNLGRFRCNLFMQQGCVGIVIRSISSEVPTFDSLGLPPILKDVVMSKRGLILLIGGTGSGKSSSLAAMVDYRNTHSPGHIITIEDPIEYVHPHKKSIITQREIGVDTQSWELAMKNSLRQAPDVILIGEIRDREAMEYAINFSETGHLCMGTLHANSANQALDRIINFFSEERRGQLLMDLGLNLRAFVSQRLIPTKRGEGRVLAAEVMLQSPFITELIFKGQVTEIKEAITKSRELGMQSLDQALFDLYEAGQISYEDALRNADSVNNLRLQIKLHSELPPPENVKDLEGKVVPSSPPPEADFSVEVLHQAGRTSNLSF